MAEAMACREALSWIKTLDIHNVEILMDCQRVISAISDTSFSLTSYFGSLIVESRSVQLRLGEYFPNLSLQIGHYCLNDIGVICAVTFIL
ncbi:unnamed protein product [Cuscuta campestris]|uniref:RNase H type-1 domain-containing protein n=1 Tax=Cuscuta campestris TaxID=132261 RepID=A0A484NQ63_9ASTE|nr:unnamed protein product [Cuscuta campestris]